MFYIWGGFVSHSVVCEKLADFCVFVCVGVCMCCVRACLGLKIAVFWRVVGAV